MNNIIQKERVQTIFNHIPKYKKLHSLSNAKLKSWHREIETYYKNRKTNKINIESYADVIFSQKIAWEKATNYEELALDYEGYIFISAKNQMNW